MEIKKTKNYHREHRENDCVEKEKITEDTEKKIKNMKHREHRELFVIKKKKNTENTEKKWKLTD